MKIPRFPLFQIAAFANRQSSIALALSSAALLIGPQAQGAVKTWQGNVTANLSGATNYTTANAPVTGDSFVFGAAGSQGSTLTNGLAATFSTVGITFNLGAAAYTMSGNAMVLAGNISNNSTALQTINFNLSTVAVRTISTNTGGITLGGNISGTSGGITKTGSGTLILGGTNSYTGATTVSAGTLNITGAGNQTGAITVNGGILQLSGAVGTITATSGIVVNQNGTFISDNTTTNNNARIGDAVPIALNGGTFSYIGNAGASADTMGVFTLNGPSLITISTPSITGRAQVATNSLNYIAGTGATLVNGIKLGGQTVLSNAGIPQFTTAIAPTLVGGTDGLTSGINSGVYNTKIVPFLLGEATSTTGGQGTASGNANTFVTYASTGGLRPLNLTDEFDTSVTLVAGNNVRVTGATTVSSDVAVNSMILNGAAVSIDDGITLTNSSGALMFSSTNSIAPTGTTGVMAFGSAPAQVTVLPTFTGTISSAISGTGGLVKNGTGNLILSGSGSYTGPTSVNGGTVSFTGAYTPSDSASTLIVNNPNRGAGNAVILNLSATAPTSVGSLSGTNSTPSSGTNTSRIDNGGQLLTINQTTNGTFDGGISGAGGLTKTGSGNLIIGSNSTYTGATIVSGGILRLTSTAAGSMASTSSISVASGAGLELVIPGGVTNSLAASLTLAGNGSSNTLNIPSNNTQTNNFTGGITLVGGAIIRTFGLANSYNFNTAKITGDATANGLNFRSEGGNSSNQAHTYNINVAADYTGNTTLTSVSQQGIIKLGVANALPTTTILTLIGSGNANSAPSLDLNGRNQTLAGLSASNATGVPRVVNSVTTASTLTINSTANQTMAGVLGGTGANNNNFALTKSGTGILSLSGTNTYTGATTVNAGGALSLLNSLAKSTGSSFTVDAGATLGLGVSAASNPYTSANVDSLFAGTLTGITNHANSNVGIDTTGGNFTYATSVSSTTRGLTKLGANTLTLSGANNYSGATQISGGTLALAGTASIASSSIIVGASTTFDVSGVTGGYTLGTTQTISGTGLVAGAMDVSGTLSPGLSPGTLSTGNQNWLNGGDYNWQVVNTLGIAGTDYDTLAITGTLDLSNLTTGGFNINLWSLASTGPDVNGNALNFIASNNYSWTLATASSAITGFDSANFLVNVGAENGATGFSNDLSGGMFSVTQSGNNLLLNFTAVPEPGVAFLGSLGMLALLRRRR